MRTSIATIWLATLALPLAAQQGPPEPAPPGPDRPPPLAEGVLDIVGPPAPEPPPEAGADDDAGAQAAPLPAGAGSGPARPAAGDNILRVTVTPDTVVQVRCRVLHTTVVVLPADEDVLDYVTGDTEFWHLVGKGHLAYLKPTGEGISTNLALVTASGRIYSFLATETAEQAPHLAVYVEREADPAEAPPHVGLPPDAPAFVPARELEIYRQDAAQARERAREGIAAAREASERAVDSYREAYPRQLRFPYTLEHRAGEFPFLVEGIWHDGTFTYIRSAAPEAPAVYELKDGEPSLVGTQFRDGVYVASHVLGEGWLQIGKERRRWQIRNPEAFGRQIAVAREGRR